MILNNILISLVILAGFAEGAEIPDFNKRIQNGQNVDIRNAKFYVFVSCGGVVCGGTLVSRTRVITAAHCVVKCNVKNARLYMGITSRNDINFGRGDIYRASQLHIYPGYHKKPNKLYYDVAVFYINGVVRQTNKVAPIAVSARRPPLGVYMTCYGYGATSVNGPGSKNLKKATIKTTRYEKNLIVGDSRRHSVLPGDSGGPCIYKNKFIGDITGVVIVNGKTRESIATLSSAPEIARFLRSRGIRLH